MELLISWLGSLLCFTPLHFFGWNGIPLPG
jgi:hypothetical protein